MTPKARSMARWREKGYAVADVEQVVPKTWIKRDAFGFGDLLCCGPDAWLLQVTDGSNHAKRREKILANENLPHVLRSGIRVAVESWRKGGPRGKRKVWQHRFEEVRL